MLPFQRIVFPVDYSEPCQSVIPYVKETVKRFSADLTLVHASGLGLEALRYSDLTIADPGWQESSRAFEEERLRKFAGESFPHQHVESIVDVGDPGSVIHKVVKHQGADLVMLPTHGRGPNHWLRELKGTLGLDVPHTVIDSDTANGTQQIAIERKADLIVVGRGHSQSTFGRIWSRLYPIISESPCPVLSI
jgi:nucleotide-binding universal stress UspA family protein